jgi:predicted permease
MKRSFRVPGAGAHSSDVEREIENHIELRAREFEAQGMSRDDARRAAIEAFGDRDAIEGEVVDIHRATVSTRHRRDWLDELRQDVRVGARVLRRAPSFALVAILTLAIGIGANTAIFGVLRSVLLRPLPYPQAEQLVQLWSDHRALGRADPEWLTPPDFADMRNDNTTFSAMAAYQGWFPDLTGNGDPESLRGALVSGNFFDVLGTRPHVGRLLSMADDDASVPPVVVLSHALWERRFGSDPNVVGKDLMLNGISRKVVGVLPESFRAPVAFASPEIFTPSRRPLNGGCGRGCVVLRAIGRMKPGVTVRQAQADLARIAARIAKDFPETNGKVGSWLVPLHEQITGDTKPALFALSAAVGFVLLIGCVNLANLLLVRGAARGREIGVRAALGAGRGRVIRQLVTENALLAVAGGVLGLALGVAGTRALGVLVPDSVRQVQEIRVDGIVLLFATAITLVSALAFGLVPALHAVRPGLMTALRSNGQQSGTSGNRLRSVLVVTQLSFAVVLLVSAGLLLRSFLMMQRVDLGFRTEGVYLASVQFPGSRYPERARTFTIIQDLVSRLRANPTIRTAEATDIVPLSGGDQDLSVIPIGAAPPPNAPPSVWYRAVTPGYLRAMQMRLVNGRTFTDDDREGAPRVAIVNEETARRLWPGQNPIGRVAALGGNEADSPRVTVVGVTASARQDGPTEPFKPEMFVPLAQLASRGVFIVLEPSRDVAAMSAAVRQTLHDIDPLVPMPTLERLSGRVETAVALPKLYATMVTLFAAAALLLAALGVYGVMSYGVTQRQREIGVRLALGAEPAGIRRMVLSQSGRLAAMGLVIGTGGALFLGQLIGKLLFGVTRFDAPTLVAVPIVLGVVTIVASWIPARRAMRLDPLSAIREE